MNVRLFPGQRRASVLACIVVRPCVSKQRISLRLHELGMSSSNPGPIYGGPLSSAGLFDIRPKLGLLKRSAEQGLIDDRNLMVMC